MKSLNPLPIVLAGALALTACGGGDSAKGDAVNAIEAACESRGMDAQGMRRGDFKAVVDGELGSVSSIPETEAERLVAEAYALNPDSGNDSFAFSACGDIEGLVDSAAESLGAESDDAEETAPASAVPTDDAVRTTTSTTSTTSTSTTTTTTIPAAPSGVVWIDPACRDCGDVAEFVRDSYPESLAGLTHYTARVDLQTFGRTTAALTIDGSPILPASGEEFVILEMSTARNDIEPARDTDEAEVTVSADGETLWGLGRNDGGMLVAAVEVGTPIRIEMSTLGDVQANIFAEGELKRETPRPFFYDSYPMPVFSESDVIRSGRNGEEPTEEGEIAVFRPSAAYANVETLTEPGFVHFEVGFYGDIPSALGGDSFTGAETIDVCEVTVVLTGENILPMDCRPSTAFAILSVVLPEDAVIEGISIERVAGSNGYTSAGGSMSVLEYQNDYNLL